MATTKALELGQFGTDLTVDDSTGAVTIANDLTMNAATSTGIDDNATTTKLTISDAAISATTANFQLTGGYNFEWGSGFSNGDPAIWANTTQKKIRIGPSGNTDGEILVVATYGVEVSGDIQTTGTLKGPSLFYIDPSTYETDSDGSSAGTAAGTVRIRGDLIVDGDTTTINSTTLTVDDLKIVVAEGATTDTDGSSAAADGAGLYVGSDTSPIASLKYDDTSDGWQIDKALGIGTGPDMLYSDGVHIYGTNPSIKIEGSTTSAWEFIHFKQPSYERLIGMRTTGAIVINSGTNLDANNHLVVENNGNVGINYFGAPKKFSVNVTADADGMFLYSNTTEIGAFARTTVGSTVVPSLDGVAGRDIHIGGRVSTDVILANAGGNVGIKNDAPTVALEVGKLVNGETQLAIFNSEGGNQVGVHVKSRTNRATLQVSDNDSTAFVQAEDNHAIYGQHSSLASADMTIDTAGNMNLQNGSYYVDQVRHDKRPVFNFDFANSKELDSRFTFVRGSRGSYVDEGGFVKYANQNVPRFDHDPVTGESLGLLIEENRSNEIIDPVNMYSSWSENSCAIQRNYALAPDGTWSAIRIQPDGLDQSSSAQQTRTVVYSTTYSISAYVKSDGADYAFLCFANTGFNGRATIIVNLSNGTVEFESGTSESSITSFVEEHKNGWYRIGLTVTSDASNGAAGSFEVGPSSESTPAAGSNANPKAGTDNTKALLVWGPQREVGTNISSYIPPTISFNSRSSYGSYFDEEGIIQYAPNNEERYTHGYDGTKVIKGGFIAEEERSNLHPGSEWNNTSNPTIAGSIVASGRSKIDFQTENTTAPDGSSWPIIITNAVTGGNYYYYNYSSLTLGVNYTFSVFFRLPNSNTENINSFTVYAHTNSFTQYYYATYDFTTDAITQSTAGSFFTIQKYPNNWRRISITAAPDANSSFDFLFHFNQAGSTTAQSYSGGGVAGLPIGYIFGAQLEQGNSPSTYISTGRSNTYGQVTRSADNAYYYDGYRLDDLCDIYDTDEINSDRGTVYTEWSSKVPSSDGVGGVFEMWDSNVGGTNGIDQRLNSFYVTNNYGVSTGNYLGANVVTKTSLGYDKDNVIDWRTTANGVHTGTNSVHKFSMNLTRLSLGRIDLNPAYMLNGHLKRFVLYNSQLQLDEQKALTENN